MNGTVVNMLARRLGCTSLYPDWYIVRKLLVTRFRKFCARQMATPFAQALINPGRVLRGTLAGLPELPMFPDKQSRNQALDNYGELMCHDRNWRWWVFAWLMIAVAAACGYCVSALVTYCNVPMFSYGFGNYLLRVGAMVFVFWSLLRKAQRVGAAAHMRLLLIDRGVAVCLRCGYCLMGHDETAERCPECGRVIDEVTRGRLGRVGDDVFCTFVASEELNSAKPQAADERIAA